MKPVKFLFLYMALTCGANFAMADPYGIADLREGDMKKLVVHTEPKDVSDAPFELEDGTQASLADFSDQITVVNFWAVWCEPCRHEMPMLSALQDALGGEHFEVLTIAVGRNAPIAMQKFFDDIDVANLPLHADRRMSMSRSMGVLGLPVTIILDRDGYEIARLVGDADWSSDSATAILETLIDAPAG
ncbi:MAG: TlpA disulfide reductase family protein [Pseudomonadota bacterium]